MLKNTNAFESPCVMETLPTCDARYSFMTFKSLSCTLTDINIQLEKVCVLMCNGSGSTPAPIFSRSTQKFAHRVLDICTHADTSTQTRWFLSLMPTNIRMLTVCDRQIGLQVLVWVDTRSRALVLFIDEMHRGGWHVLRVPGACPLAGVLPSNQENTVLFL